jgi:hypothetical protein
LVSLSALFQFADTIRVSSANDVTGIDDEKDKNYVSTMHSAKNEQRRHQYQITHIHVSSCAFAWSSFLVQTIPVAVPSSGIVVEDLGEEGSHIQRGRMRSAGDFGQLLFRAILPSHESADTFPT